MGHPGYFLRVFRCADGRILFGYEGMASYRQNVVYDYESGSYTELGHGDYPIVLENGKLALVTFNTLTLFEADGGKSETQLQFDWGRILAYEDEPLIKTLSASYDYDFYPEYVPIGVEYDAQTGQYIALFDEDGSCNLMFQGGRWRMKGHSCSDAAPTAPNAGERKESI